MADQDHILNAQTHGEADPRTNVARRIFKPLPQRAADDLVASKLWPSTSQQVSSKVVPAVIASHEDVPGSG